MSSTMAGTQPPQHVPAPEAFPTWPTVRAPAEIAERILASLMTWQWQINMKNVSLLDGRRGAHFTPRFGLLAPSRCSKMISTFNYFLAWKVSDTATPAEGSSADENGAVVFQKT